MIRDKDKKHKEKKHKKADKKSKHNSPSSSKKKRKKSKHASKSSSLEKSASRDISMSPTDVIGRPSPNRTFLGGSNNFGKNDWEEEDDELPRRNNGSSLENEGERRITPPLLQRVAAMSSPHTPPLPPKAYENSKLDKRYKPQVSPAGR